jgi:hypothetical protein
MLRVSGPKMTEFAKELDGIEINGIHFKQEGVVQGIQAVFSTDAEDEELAKGAVKAYFKANHPVYRIYVEVI